MDLRSLPDGLSPAERINERRKRIESALDLDLSDVRIKGINPGLADEKNCEQMFGVVPVPVGYAGPLAVTFSDGSLKDVHLPLATTEGALVASVNRGCKALTMSGGVKTVSIRRGISRSMAFFFSSQQRLSIGAVTVEKRAPDWKTIAEATSDHLKILTYEIDQADDHLFLTIYADTDEAMGMNMVTIAAQAVGEWIEKNIDGCRFITVAGNVDSDKKPSKRTHDHGRGFDVTATATLSPVVIADILKSDPQSMMDVAIAKLKIGSEIAEAIGRNLHAANSIAALYLATGQDSAHVVEGSLADTTVDLTDQGLHISVRLPAILVGLRGGGTGLPAQKTCLDLLLHNRTTLHLCHQLAQSIGAAVLAGEVSLLAAQAGHHLATAHKNLGR